VRISLSVDITSAYRCVGRSLGCGLSRVFRSYCSGNVEEQVLHVSSVIPGLACRRSSKWGLEVDVEDRGRQWQGDVTAWRVEIKIHAHPFLANCMQPS
jgi:hypothetical protein